MTTLAFSRDEIKQKLRDLATSAGDVALTFLHRGNVPEGYAWKGPWRDWVYDFRQQTALPWSCETDVVDAIASIEAEHEGPAATKAFEHKMAKFKLSFPAELGAIMRDNYRDGDHVLAPTRLFLDLDGIEIEDATRLRKLMEHLNLNYCIAESATSRMETIHGFKNPLKLHGYIQIHPVTFSQRTGGVTTEKLSQWWGESYVLVAHAILSAAGIDHGVVKIDQKVKDPARQSYVPHIPPRWNGEARGFYPREGVECGGLALDFAALALWLGGQPMPQPSVEPQPAPQARERGQVTTKTSTTSSQPVPTAPESGPTPGHSNASLLILAFQIFGKQGLRLRKGWFTRLEKARAERRNPLTAADFGPPRNYFRGNDRDGHRNVFCVFGEESSSDGNDDSTCILTEGEQGYSCQHSQCHAAAGGQLHASDVLRVARYVCMLTGEHFPEQDGGDDEAQASDLVTLKKSKKDEPSVDVDDAANKRAIFAALAEMNAAHAMVKIKSKVGVLWTKDNTIMGKDAFFDWYSNKPVILVDQNGDEKEVNRAALWWGSKTRREYATVAFRPELTQAAAACQGTYNLWKGFAVERDPDGDCSLFLAHVLDNIADGDHASFDYIMGYLAHMFQHPDRRLGVGLVLLSKGKGTGKNVFVDIIGHILGNAYFMATQARQITGNFNQHLEHTLLLHAAEAVWAANRGDEGILKSLVTDGTIPIERKGYETYQAKNYLHVVVSSNEDHAVPASSDERRWAVFKVGEAQKQNRPYFAAIIKQMEAGGYGALLDILMSIDLAAVDLNQVPNTEALVSQKMQSLPALDKWLFEATSHNAIPGSKRVVSIIKETQKAGSITVEAELSSKMLDRAPWPDDEPVEVARPELFDAYATWCQRNRMPPPSENTFAKPLREMFSLGSSRGVYWLPPLNEVRQVLARKYGLAVTTESEPVRVVAPGTATAAMRN